ncbi:MAG TPA: PLD nuclease N-terminal domain-containing protein [Cyclobacteriaceae bacterium]|nr:PLD nuclease N-terminal domain-containing protein [Cyclobacteriaceae bacterium]HMV10301.1 PLD nuclease N-terminal domain-containing protein [Cyclobacteriaceae bacterium]HMV90615.1 PLD nuclease N-terminal domain-containing protein [Cyclobacteriaceae bacterium]HMX02826.1 PLD nuclease N-terminal domain-containing protein [Cyclobacteriaceae bacterium]HMX50054.1 PLD nuclease N-terminal domain-containing protein [Cyclobacteriaceae bacterium]
MVRIIYFLVLIIDVLAIIDVWQRESNLEKRLLWSVVILLLPIAGPLAWYLVSRRIINL